MNKNIKTKFQEATHDDLMRWIVGLIGIAVFLLLVVFGIYLRNFGKNGISANPAEWGEFGDFVGGTANPILGFLTLIALVLTIIIQSRQLSVSSHELELSRTELELTREELRRSAEAQELSGIALRAQAEAADRSARLSGINFLLEHYKNEIKKIHNRGPRLQGDPNTKQLQLLSVKERTLLSMLNDMFDEMTEKKKDSKAGHAQ